MYFTIAGITGKILFWLFVAAFTHLGFNGFMALLANTKFELPFYLKPIYPFAVKLMNEFDYYSNHKEGEPVTYFMFTGMFLLFAMVASLINLLLFPIVSIPIACYLYISFKMEFGGEDSEEKKDEDSKKD